MSDENNKKSPKWMAGFAAMLGMTIYGDKIKAASDSKNTAATEKVMEDLGDFILKMVSAKDE